MRRPDGSPTVALGLDIGGTKVAGGLVDDAGRIRVAARGVTPGADPDPEALWAVVEAVLVRLLAATADSGSALTGVGLSCAGPIDVPAGTVSPINIAGWRAFPLVDRVRRVLTAHAPSPLSAAGGEAVPVVLAGDGTATALAEQRFGAARGVADLVGIVVSTGIGGGLVLGGEAFTGRTGNAGHIGHVVVEPGGLACTCGGFGCLETVASGPSSVRWALAEGWQPPPGGPPGTPTGVTLAAAARAGDPVAVAAVARSGRAVGEVIAGVAAVDDLSMAVIGGGFAQQGELLMNPLRAAVERHAGLSFLRGFRVAAAELGAEAGVVGAACLVGAGSPPAVETVLGHAQ